MECLTAVVGSLAGTAAEYTVDPITRQVGYLLNYKSNCKELEAQLEKLKDAREQVQRRIDEANRNGDNILDRVETWLTGVNGKISAAEQLVEDETEAKKRCFSGLCPNFKSRYQFSKKAAKEAISIAELLEREDKFDRVSYRPALEGIAALPAKDYEGFESRRGAFDGVMLALKDADVSIIGVYGMGGVGKTTLVKQVASQAKEEKLFDYVVMAAVTQTPNILNIQNEIGEKLGMELFDEKSCVDVRAGRLCERLKKEKNVLVILDDIWEEMDLDAVGVPSRDQHMGCKILVTSRRLDLLQSMGSQSNLAIEKLTEKEAWSLFKNMAGDVVERSDIQSTAAEVAQKCAGLPIAIAAVAKALKHKKQPFIWNDALQKLKRPSKENFKGIAPDVYSAIELSYAFLEAEEVQLTFLLCCIMRHNAAIEDLLIYCRGFGLFRDLDTIQKVRDRILTLVSDLKNSSLLLSSSITGCFDMHDVVRDVAVSIASSDRHWLALSTKEVSQYLSNEETEETMQNYNLISFQHAEVSGLPDELECSNLTFFSMGVGSDKRSALKIPNNFFKGMQKLKVLYFANMEFSSLPLSTDFHLLKTLRTLYLFRCELEDINIIGELMNLEILNLSRSIIKILPREIGKLRKLKLLNLSGCYYLRVIPQNVLSRLSRLEELYLFNSFDRWELVEGRKSPARSNASLVELNNLSHLTILEVHVGDVNAMPKDTTFFGKLERYKISIGPQRWPFWDENKLETSRVLKLSDRGDKMFDDGLLRKVENLCLDGVKDVSNLERVCWIESFSQLRVLRVRGCERLNNLFSFSVAREFHQLEEIEVFDCKNITELIAEKREEETLKFDKLNSLKLSNLPKLIHLCGMEKNLSSSKQGRDQSSDWRSNGLCLFDQKVELPMLEVLQIKRMENLERLWPNQLADEESFPKLTQLRLERCHKLLNVFPLSMSRRLQRLEKLKIIDCKLVEEIFEESYPSGVVQAQDNIIRFEFPELIKLELVDLPNLKSFYHQIHTIKLSSLKSELKVSGCDKVGILFDSSFPKTGEKNQQEISINPLPFFCLSEHNLEELSMGWKDAMKEICLPQQIASQYFCKLKVVRLLSFPKEMEIFPSNLFKFLTSLPNLHHLEIRYAYFEEILEEMQEKEELFQNLRKLEVRCCPKLKDNLVPSSVYFKNLVTLQVESCPGIIKLLTYTTAKSLVQLQEMRISSCVEIEEIIEGSVDDDEDGEVKDEIRYPQLKLLELENLRKLESFCSSGNHTFLFPSLQNVIFSGCPLMKMFSQGDSYTPMLHKVTEHENDKKGCWSGNLNSTIQEMFKKKKSKEDEDNPSTLEQLTLEWNYEMKEIWHSYGPLQQLPSQYFCTLKVVTIDSFPNEMDIFPSQLFQFLISLPNLQRLEIEDSDFKEIFQSEEKLSSALEDQEQVVFPAIEELRFSIEKLRHDGIPQIASFGLLTTLTVSACDKLKYLFPSSTVKSFVQLKTLVVSYCDEMEQLIILSEGLVDEERNNIMVFPQLDYLKLLWLPNLKRFCSGNRTEFPSLRKLKINNCPALSTASEVSKNNITMENCHADVPQYLFNEGFSFSNLEELGLGWNDGMKEICNAHDLPQQFGFQYFCNLKVIKCLTFPEEMEIFPSQLFQFLISLFNLQGLEIRNAYFKEIFESPSSALEKVQLKEALFQNLMTLKLCSCREIKKLVTHSTAKSLGQLQELRISFCSEIEEIIEGNGDDDDDEDGEVKNELIRFPQLKHLELIYLQKLKSFCSLENCTFQFPSLEIVIVKECPKMKMFSQADSYTPMLHKVKLNKHTWKDKERWSGSLNSTIEEMFKEQVWD